MTEGYNEGYNEGYIEGYITGNIGAIKDCHNVCPGDKCDACCRNSKYDPTCLRIAVTDIEEGYEDIDHEKVETNTKIDIGAWIYISFLGVILLGLLIYLILKNRFR